MSFKQRVKCPHCGEIANVEANITACPKCKKDLSLSGEGLLYLHRQGSAYGVAGSFGIYLNNEPFGHIGNAETLCFPLPYGTYNIHCAAGMNRKCKDLQITLSPAVPRICAKVYMKPGFWSNSFVVEPLDPAKLGL